MNQIHHSIGIDLDHGHYRLAGHASHTDCIAAIPRDIVLDKA